MFRSVQFSSVTQSCPTVCNSMDCSTAGFPVHHQSPQFTQTCGHSVGEAIQPSDPVFPFSSHLQSFPASGSFHMSQLFTSGGESIGFSASASVLPMIQDGFPLGWTGWISRSPRNSQESSSTPQFKSVNSSVLNFLYNPTLTSIHDYWKNNSFDYTDLWWQSIVSAF